MPGWPGAVSEQHRKIKAQEPPAPQPQPDKEAA